MTPPRPPRRYPCPRCGTLARSPKGCRPACPGGHTDRYAKPKAKPIIVVVSRAKRG